MVNAHIQFLKIKKLTGSNIIAIASRHNLREIQAELGADSHINPLRTSLNVVLRGAAAAAADIAADALKLMQGADVLPLRKNAVVALEIVISLPSESGIDERGFFTSSVDWAESFFEIPILSAIIHNDEAAPHCHIVMLPLFDGRMMGSDLVGNKVRLLAMQSDFNAKVGQAYGLAKPTPAKRHSASARLNAADRVVRSLQKNPKKLDDPAIRDALRDCLAETMPVNLLALLNLELPEPVAPKKQTFAGIMTQNKPERKIKKPIGNVIDTKPIGNIPNITHEKVQTLSCVGFAVSPPIVQPANPSIPDHCDGEYTRTHDDDLTTGYWDAECGEMMPTPSPRTRKTAPAIEQTRAKIISLQERRSA